MTRKRGGEKTVFRNLLAHNCLLTIFSPLALLFFKVGLKNDRRKEPERHIGVCFSFIPASLTIEPNRGPRAERKRVKVCVRERER